MTAKISTLDSEMPPAFPTVAESFRAVEEYRRLVEAARGEPLPLTLNPLDGFLMTRLAAFTPAAPAVIDLAAASTAGASTLLWWAQNGIEKLIVPMNGQTAWKPLTVAAAAKLGLDAERVAFAEWPLDVESVPPLAPVMVLLADATELANVFKAFADPVVIVNGLGRLGECTAIEECLAFCRGGEHRFTALRELSPFLAASRLGTIARADHSDLPAALIRLGQLFDGNFQYLPMVRAASEAAVRIKALEAEVASLRANAGKGARTLSRRDYVSLVHRLRRLIEKAVPSDHGVIVVSKGDDALVTHPERPGYHFPQTEAGEYAGHYPADSDAAIDHLEAVRAKGGRYFVIPQSSAWWLEHYVEFTHYLETCGTLVADEPDTGMIFRLDAAQRSNGKPRESTVKLIAFYLPQFHPIPENDAWWGPGFTEWTNVVRAEPLFPGHKQPHLPTDLGFTDLRSPETRQAQAELAKQYGIHGFCYYHYWFHGKRLLERPFDEVLKSGSPDLPFCLCWANEAWSRRWDGGDQDILQPQKYSEEDDLAHIHSLLPALTDPRAIRVGDKPLFLVYRAQDLPDSARTAEVWRREAERAGLPGLHLVAVETAWDLGRETPGFDAKLLFQPQWNALNALARRKIDGMPNLKVYDYAEAVAALSNPEPVKYRRYDTVFPSWDNSPRTKDRAYVFQDATPGLYEEWLRRTIRRAAARPVEHQLVFINAWNEWGEGCHLEPDRIHGRAYLEATQRALVAAARKVRS